MIEEILLPMPSAYSREVERHLVMDNKLRIYRRQPERIDLQVRTHSDKRARISGCGLTREQARVVADRLARFAETGE